ncbi:MAG: helix-turn-helix transcriptional regulator [Clostridia bacterium]|nr:helix-turn-helix transcriptional regulator [Clostridia bacterium]
MHLFLLYHIKTFFQVFFEKTQKQIAEILNMQPTVYQRYERGERELPLWAAIKLADYYNVTLDYLVERNE